MKAPSMPSVVVVAAVMGAALVGFYVWKKGGIAQAASGAGAAAVDAAGGFASGAVGAIGAGVGLPTPDVTTTSPRVARWIIDNHGYFEASKWAGAGALWRAMTMDAGTGVPPPAGSALAAALPVLPVASYDETERLLQRYPAPASTRDPAVLDYGSYSMGA